MAQTVQFVGDRQLRKAFGALKKAARRRIARAAVSKSMTPINKEAKRKAKAVRDSGLLRKSIGKKLIPASRMRNKALVAGFIGPRAGFRKVIDGKPRNPVKYAHLVEKGTQPHWIAPKRRKAMKINGDFVRGRVQHPGARATPFMRPAFDTRAPQAQRIMAVEFRRGLIREAKRVSRGPRK